MQFKLLHIINEILTLISCNLYYSAATENSSNVEKIKSKSTDVQLIEKTPKWNAITLNEFLKEL